MAHAKLKRVSVPSRAGLRAESVDALRRHVDTLPRRGWCSGAVLVAGRGPYVALEHATGLTVRYRAYDPQAGRGIELPRAEQVSTAAGTLFDLASLTKVFTAVTAMQQVERGVLSLDGTVASYVAEFGGAGKSRVTVRQLIAHTSGLRPELPFYERPDDPLSLLWGERQLAASGTYCYSDLNYIALQLVLEWITGSGLDTLVRDGITGPLGMESTSYGPVPAASAAATEDQRRPWAKADRGMLRGTVHDENAHALGGVAGHAGLFSTASDVAVFCRALLNGGAYGTARILAPASVARLLQPPGLGLQTDRPWFMGELAGPLSEGRAAGHTGFTGTSLVLDPVTDTFLVLLANTVHPVRRSPDSGPRAAAGTLLARAVR